MPILSSTFTAIHFIKHSKQEDVRKKVMFTFLLFLSLILHLLNIFSSFSQLFLTCTNIHLLHFKNTNVSFIVCLNINTSKILILLDPNIQWKSGSIAFLFISLKLSCFLFHSLEKCYIESLKKLRHLHATK